MFKLSYVVSKLGKLIWGEQGLNIQTTFDVLDLNENKTIVVAYLHCLLMLSNGIFQSNASRYA